VNYSFSDAQDQPSLVELVLPARNCTGIRHSFPPPAFRLRVLMDEDGQALQRLDTVEGGLVLDRDRQSCPRSRKAGAEKPGRDPARFYASSTSASPKAAR